MNPLQKKLLAALGSAVASGELVPFIGAGMSSSNLPSSNQILDALFKRRVIQRRKESLALSQLSKEDRFRVVRALQPFSKQTEVAAPNLLAALCSLPLKLFFTTNYDSLLEDCLRDVGRNPETMLTPWDLSLRQPSHSGDVTVVKLHGDLSLAETVILGGGEREPTQLSISLLTEFADTLSESVILFLGFSHDSKTVAHAIKTISQASSHKPKPSITVCFDQGPETGDAEDGDEHKTYFISRQEFEEVVNHIATYLGKWPDWKKYTAKGESEPLGAYLKYLSRLVHRGWTVDPNRNLNTGRVEFRVRVEPIFHSQKLLEFSSKTESPHCQTLDEESFGEREFTDVAQTTRRLMITGAPGVGKSTLLRWLTYQFAKSNQPLSPFPIFIVAHNLSTSSTMSLESVFKGVESSCAIAGLASSLHRLAEAGRVILIVDGIDELPFAKINETVQLLRSYSSAFPESRWIASCRRHGFEEMMESEADLVVSPCPFSKNQISHFLDNWFEGDWCAEGTAAKLKGIIENNVRVAELAKIPLFLSLIAQDYKYNSSKILSAFRLFERVASMLLGEWDRQRGVFREYSYPAQIKLEILAQCAFRSVREDKLEIRLSDCLDSLSEISHKQVELREAIALLSEIEQGSGLVYKVNEDSWQFSHRSFLDYFAAQGALGLTEQELTGTISAAVNKSAWMSPIALALSEFEHGPEAKKLWGAARLLFPSKGTASLRNALFGISASTRKSRA